MTDTRLWLGRAAAAACLAMAGQVQADALHPPGQSAAAAPVRIDELRHGSLDRVIIWRPMNAGMTFHWNGSELAVSLADPAQMVPPVTPGRDATAYGAFGQWVHGLKSGPGWVRLALAPGSHPRIRPLVGKIWIDVDGGTPRTLPGQFTPTLSAPEAAPPPAPPAPPPTPVLKAAPSVPAPAAPSITAATIAAPVSILAETASLGGPSILIPLPGTAAASFTRAGDLHVVFDAPKPLDLGALKDDPFFGAATETLLPDAADFRLHEQAGTQPRLTRRDTGWVLTLAGTPSPFKPFVGKAANGVLSLAAPSPGGVVALEDAGTGGRLLVGTQHEAGTRVLWGHAAAEFALLPSWGGVVIQPRSDRVRMRARDSGFQVSAQDPPALALAWQNEPMALRADGQPMTRRFDFTSAPLPVLKRRLGEALRDAARAPRTARTAPRLLVAETMLAAGLDTEAGAVLRVAAVDDPQANANTDLRALSAISAWTSARAGFSQPPPAGFDLASLGDSDEAVVWRALLSPPTADPARAAAQLAPRWPILLDYPAGLSRLMLPEIADLLERGRQDDTLKALVAAFPVPALELPHAALLARLGQTDQAVRLLDGLAAGRDRLLRARAMEASVELRLAAGQLTPDVAAAALDKQLYAWRDEARELRLRQRIAALQATAGHWRKSLAGYRETEALFPASHDAIHAAEIGVVADILKSGRASRLDALDVIALADEASNLLAATDADSTLAPLVAEKLVALDLPNQAEPILRRLMDRAAGGSPKAGIGLRLATLLADNGDEPGALLALDASDNAQLDPAIAQPRTLLKARLLGLSHRTADALAVLDGQTSAAALEMRAGLHEAQQDWANAEQALAIYAALPDFPRQSQSGQQQIILRALRDALEGHDMAAVRRWRALGTPLFEHAQNAALFSVLTAEPVRHIGDLPRSAAEIDAMRALPASLAVASAKP